MADALPFAPMTLGWSERRASNTRPAAPKSEAALNNSIGYVNWQGNLYPK